MAGTAAGVEEAIATAAGGDSDDLAPSQHEDENDGGEEQAARGVAPSGGLEGVMLLLTQLINNMPATMAAAIKADKPQSHLANAQLDNRNFQRIKTFTNKHADWREWKNQFVYAVAECDNPFAATLSSMEKRDEAIDATVDLNPTQNQLSAVLFN